MKLKEKNDECRKLKTDMKSMEFRLNSMQKDKHALDVELKKSEIEN